MPDAVEQESDRLCYVLSDGTLDELAELLQSGVNPSMLDSDGDPVLCTAMLDPAMVYLLIKAGADVHARFEGFLGTEYVKDLSFVEYVCELCCNASDPRDLQMWGAEYRQSLAYLLEAGADPSVRLELLPEELEAVLRAHKAATGLDALTPVAQAPSARRRL